MRKTRLFSILALLLMVTQGAWATQPNGAFDGVEPHPGSIRVHGWAYDPDHSSESIDVHVYVYSNSECTILAAVIPFTANGSRPDVNSHFSITGNHGYDVYVHLPDLTAGNTYYVRVYAIDKDNDGNPAVDTGTDGRKRPFVAQAPYSVTYNANNGSGEPSAQKKCHNINLTLSSTVPTRDGYTFDGWNTASDGSGTNYASGATYTDNTDLTLYAKWIQNTATLTDDSDLSALSAWAGKTCTVTYKRAFTAGKPSTVCLPFAYAKKTGETFYTFTGITKVGDEYVATMTEHTGATLAANTPYLYKSAATGDTDFSGTYTMPATISAGETASGDWKFVGTYETQEWTTAPTGIYGFSAQNTAGGISQGEFVKVGAYVKVKPMRAYLKYKDGGEDYAGARSMDRAASSETLPETISVRLIDAEGNVTGIGTLETRTGEVRFDPEAWYTLNGVRLSGQPTQKGIYVNNGKKVIIK